MLNKEETNMAETNKEKNQVAEEAKPVERDYRQELEVAHKENAEIREQYNQLATSAQKLYQENQTLRASLKAIATLL